MASSGHPPPLARVTLLPVAVVLFVAAVFFAIGYAAGNSGSGEPAPPPHVPPPAYVCDETGVCTETTP